uniref:DNA-directed RNA polymerase subunit n=1 Tax=Polytomella parva TaxID=51329 RepID=A0A7S0YI02_9CHLO|mmetsp:Transcript_2130/g.3203  ORF Transcript_2130/g.3203 Transcript_2130/m.3203 type:complete len:1482 (+) Transcript_2130:61-4506(+)
MAHVDKFPYSTAPLKRVKAIQFSVWDPQEILKYSVVEVTESETYEKGRPKPCGLSDARLGTMDRDGICTTDYCNNIDSPGYFGHIALAKPVYHIGFLKTVIRVLRCVSYHSSRILLEKDDVAYRSGIRIRDPEKRLQHFLKFCSNKTEDIQTKGPQPKYRLDGVRIMMDFSTSKNKMEDMDNMDQKQELSAQRAMEILKNISEEDCQALGFDVRFSRPHWMIIQNLPVPPPPVRPSVMMDSSSRCEDDLTYKLAEIVRTNKSIKRSLEDGAPPHLINEALQLLQWHVTTYIDNTIPGVDKSTQKSGRAIKSISERLKSKTGRVRGNLMGKRVDFSARTVITGDPNIGIDELGVPWSIALNLTFPESVTPFNIHHLQNLVTKGPNPPPGETGAKCIIRKDGRRINLAVMGIGMKRTIEYGDIVERHLQNGDLVLFNRQPSLHKMSMMGHRVRILPYSTFRLNLSVTTPYNADFDGDEMNMHVAQSHETRAEMQQLMMVPRNIVSPQANKPVMGIVQDTLLGTRLMTKRDIFITKEVMMNTLMGIEDWDGTMPLPAILAPIPLWTGKQVFSMFIPQVNLRNKSSWHNERNDPLPDFSLDDSQVLIKGGELITGAMCKKTVGNGAGGLVHVIWIEHGPDSCRQFINNTQKTVNYWLLQHGMSIGIADTVADVATMRKIETILEKGKEDVRKIVKQYQNNLLEANPGMTVHESFESQVNEVLNNCRNDAGKEAQNSVNLTNNIIKMVTSGSKGSSVNISQMMGCVGQQNVEGKRIPYGFDQRTLPHFPKGERGPEARGFVENSYLRGLTPQEFFFHAMGGREGLIDTAVKTATTGYIQRRLVKAMEDLVIRYGGTVRNSQYDVVQFLYGEDGMDATRVEGQFFEYLKVKPEKFDQMFRLPLHLDTAPHWMSVEEFDTLRSDALAQRLVKEEYETLCEDLRVLKMETLSHGEDKVNIPLNIKRMIWNAQTRFNCRPHRKGWTKLPALDVIRRVRELCSRLVVVVGADSLSVEAQRNSTLMFYSMLRMHLSAKRVLAEYKLTEEAFTWLLGEIENRFNFALAASGECIGTLAAQSLGEPTTQMTLNTFHLAGVSNKMTQGVPRLTEIINLAKNIKTPGMYVYVTKEFSKDSKSIKIVQSQLEYTCLKNIIQKVEVWYDPIDIAQPENTVVEEDLGTLDNYYSFLGDEDEERKILPSLSTWLLRLELARGMMADRELTMEQVQKAILRELTRGANEQGIETPFVHVIASDTNADNLILRIRYVEDEANRADVLNDETMKMLEAAYIRDIRLHGVAGINKAFIREQTRSYFDELGRYQNVKEWRLETEGTNLREVLAFENVDFRRTTTNNILEVFEVLGIEAGRAALFNEIRSVLQGDGSYINFRHISALVDIMTCKGNLMAITRHGINRNGNGPLTQCSFEETVDILFRAACFAERDNLQGVSDNIMLGNLCPIGTGCFDLTLDEKALEDSFDVNLDQFSLVDGRGGE